MNICDVYKVQILILTFLIILAIVLFVAAWVKNRDADKNTNCMENLHKSITMDISGMSYNELEAKIEALVGAGKALVGVGIVRSMEDNFQHFLSYSGFRDEPVEMQEKLRKAFEAGGK